jgi:hypothetical protein
MHYLVQATLAELQAAAVDVFDGVDWVKAWQDHGGDKYIGHYTQGQLVLSGPLISGNPTEPWFEVQCANDAVLDDLGFPYGLMRDEVRKPGHLRGAYQASIASPVNDRRLIRNGANQVVGVTPNFVICGTHPAASFLAGEDVDTAEEITGLE